MLVVILLNLVLAKDAVSQGLSPNEQMFTIIGLIFGSSVATLGLLSFIYFTLKFIKRKMSEPQYVIDKVSDRKDNQAIHPVNDDFIVQIPHISQIQPVLSIPYMYSSVKQSLSDLRTTLVPSSWSRVQHFYDSTPKKTDLPT
ncbi:unnamed protein product [Adineta ricciae]|uniref:Uncharacterized protein n=1 Tax=Adineta ricciae TaxID=249248 RepID=A0A815XGQ2_ADIRI|nr:unnamed protein product [Adineta ricciae]CAF1557360.1 unnamed protein product [Adineta ricciae]